MKSLIDILFPPVCLGCAGDTVRTERICASCRKKLVPDPLLQCSVCRGRIPFGAAANERCHPRASHVVFSAGSYSDPILRNLIWQCKFKSRQAAGRILADLLAEALADTGFTTDDAVFVPIPLSAKRLRLRGFNQAEKIADFLLQKSGRAASHYLVRVKDTAAQSEISDYKQRRINMAHAFALQPGVSCAGKKIVLVDDVWTSGATMSEAVSVLKHAGASEIIALVVARAH